jgi:hypothetical protein
MLIWTAAVAQFLFDGLADGGPFRGRELLAEFVLSVFAGNE